ncbi:hypothetical protein PRZ48_005352 [Zasmidium cellare]|uniref:Polyketide synthase n=1 Tax=Zasmidium cellare TaxID=395010 RepID=A0ABR0ES61_ZASCE|nr:hypothetical protein PRZ48_005352 [Zasmidium cellare]
MSPKEAEQTDPMMRLALVTAYEAMEMAGVVPGRTTSSSPSRIGTYFGQASDDWRELNASQNIGTYAVPGGVRGFTTGRINFFNKYSGPSFNIDTACSSSMAAVQAGCTALWSGEVDTVVAGGVNVITDPDNYAGLCNAYFLSKTGQCKVWDKSADGYCRAEGIGSVVIKRLEDAQADNDNVLAVILSAATNHSADAISITHPHAGAQKTNYRTVLQRAGVHPFDVSYVEMHGTGTQAGDAIESESVLDTFAPTSPRRRLDQPLHLGAVKSNIGHGEAAAGISSLIKAILCFQHERIPPHIGITTEINPAIPKDLDRRNVSLAGADTTWSRSSGHRTAMVNSFGASGGNTTLLLEDGPSKTVERQSSTRTSHAIIISAKSRISLRGNIESLCDYLDQHPDTDLGSLSYTLCARRIHHNLRLATTVTSISALQKFLRSKLDTDLSSVRPVSGDKPSVIFAFTGQGAAYAGSPSLMKESITFRQQILQLDGIVQRQGFSSVLSIVEGTSSEEYASHPVVSQLAIVVLEIAVARYWTELGMHPSAVIGHSLGEYAAMVVSGILSASDAIFLVGRRAQLTMEKCTLGSYAMLSVRAEQGTIESTLKNNSGGRRFAYEVACRNGETDIVLGAPKDDIAAMSQILQAAGHKCTELAMPFAFHTTQMDAVVDDLHALASDIPFHASSVPYISSLLGEVVFDHKTIDANYLKRQTRETVNFVGAVQAATEVGVASAETVWIDIGPHPILAGLIKTILPGSNPLSSNRRNEDTVDTLTKSLVQLHAAGLEPAWGEHFRGQEHGYSMLDLPKYSWNEVNYWIPYRGTWTLEKALLKYGQTSILPAQAQSPAASAHPTLRTSLVHETLFEEVNEDRGTLRALSYMHHPDFRKAVEGHTMNGHGVATSSIWSEMALSIGQYLLQRLGTDPKSFGMDLANFEVLHGQVLNKDKNAHQAIIVNASLNMSDRSMTIDWSSVQGQDLSVEPTAFASGIVYFDDVEDWKVEWSRVNHLVNTQIATLEIMASEGRANQLSKNLAYTLFKNVVDYAPEYRGMDRVVMNEYEAFADITLSNNRGGTWHTPPHWIDSVAHLAGLVMNGSDASDTATYFFVTPGSESLRISKPLEAGGKYRSYVRMFPVSGDPSMHAGDVYILQDEKIIGLLRQIRFRRVHRLLMDRFFSPPSASANSGGHSAPNPPAIQASNNAVPHAGRGAGSSSRQQRSKPQGAQAKAEVATPPEPIAAPVIEISATKVAIEPAPVEDVPGLAVSSASSSSGGDSIQTTSSTVSRCLDIIARETNIDVSTLTADAEFPALGIDSLLSLVLSEKFRAELGLDVKSSLFLECPTVGEMTAWLEQYS